MAPTTTNTGRIMLAAQADISAIPGDYQVPVKAEDSFNLSSSDIINLRILQNQPPSLAYWDTVVFPGGGPFYNAPGTFTDDDATFPTSFTVSQPSTGDQLVALTVDNIGVVTIVTGASMSEGDYPIAIRVTGAVGNQTDATFYASISSCCGGPGSLIKNWMRY